MKTVVFRIIPKKKGWIVRPLVNGMAVNAGASLHTSRTKALHNSLRKVFADNPGRRAFNLILEVEE